MRLDKDTWQAEQESRIQEGLEKTNRSKGIIESGNEPLSDRQKREKLLGSKGVRKRAKSNSRQGWPEDADRVVVGLPSPFPDGKLPKGFNSPLI